MRLLAMGDIHGCTIAFDRLIEAVHLKAGDQLVTLGDYVDRGPDSKGIIERLLKIHATGLLIPLRGNHDYMMLEACNGFMQQMDWIACGGDTTLESYPGPGEEWFENVPASHWEFLQETCRDWYETETHFFVHANANPELPLDEQPLYMLHWEKLIEARPHVSGKIMVCGHTPQKDGRPLNLGHTVCIDTWVYGAGWLTCLEVETGRYWQANQQRDLRTGVLEPPAMIDME